jgi:hypothetical protein
MCNEADFINAIIADDVDNQNDVTLYEIWKGTKESWLKNKLPKQYREKYESKLGDLIEERIISYLTPVAEWGSNLINEHFA